MRLHFTPKKLASWVLSLLMLCTVAGQPVFAQSYNMLDFTEINNQTWEPRDCQEGGSTTSILIGSDNIASAYNFLAGDHGLQPVQAAAIVGNLMQESGVNPTAVNSKSGAYGIAQWLGGRKTALQEFATGKQLDSLAVQLDYLWFEVTEGLEKGVLDSIKNETALATNEQAGTGGAVEKWERAFERAGEHEKNYPKRYSFAKSVLDKYGSTTPAGQSTSGQCACENATGKTVVLDPGHGVGGVKETDPISGVSATEYANHPEMEEVWDISQKVATDLRGKGYKVIITKDNVNAAPGLIGRARIANEAKADIAVSIHNDHGQQFNSFKWVTPQEVGLYRETDGKRKTFDNAAVAQKSQEYSQKFVEARNNAEGGGAQIHRLDFPAGRGLDSTGNISIVQLFATVPWVYLEVGGQGWSQENADKYTKGIIDGITASLSVSDVSQDCVVGANGDVARVAMEYAWPTYHETNQTEQKPAYTQATANAKGAGKYIGGCNGNDCGGFVTRVMQDSGADPNYNNIPPNKGPVTSQESYIKANSKYQLVPGPVTSPSQLEQYQFAIAIQNDQGHTFLYIGNHKPQFDSIIASASYSTRGCGFTRAPMAGRESLSGNRFYVLKE